jgi:hypothetical protein
MSDCQKVASLLIEYIEARSENSNLALPKILKEHLANCQVCRKLINTKSLWQTFITYNANSQKIASRPLPAVPNKILPGQIWKLRFPDRKQLSYCLVLSEVYFYKMPQSELVKIIPVFCSPLPEELAGTDILLKSDQWRPGIPALIEIWNPWTIKTRQLIEFVDHVDKQTLKALNQYEPNAEHNEIIQAFRASEINRFSELAGLPDSTKIMHKELARFFDHIKLIFKQTIKTVKDIFKPPIETLTLVKEPSIDYVAATQSPNYALLWQQWFRYALADDSSLPFKIKIFSDGSFKLKHLRQKRFAANFHQDKQLAMRVSSNDKGSATFSARELNNIYPATITRVSLQTRTPY